MNKQFKSALSLFLAFILVFSLASCGEEKETGDLWQDALYTEDTALGEGDQSFTLIVEAADKSVTFSIASDSKTVGEALLALELIDGEESQYGLYVKVVNGITADYDVDGTYWAFYVNDTYAVTGVDSTDVVHGALYKLVRTK